MNEDLELVLSRATTMLLHHFLSTEMFFVNFINRCTPTHYFSYQRNHDPLNQLQLDDISVERFIKTYRILPTSFLVLLNKISPYLESNNSNNIGRPRIQESIRQGVYLYYIGREPNFFDAGFAFGISKTSVVRIVDEISNAILNALDGYIQLPSEIDEIRYLTQGFTTKCLIPNVCGAIDGY